MIMPVFFTLGAGKIRKKNLGRQTALAILMALAVFAGAADFLTAQVPAAVGALFDRADEAEGTVRGRVGKLETKSSGAWIYLSDCVFSPEGEREEAVGGTVLIVPDTGRLPKTGWIVSAYGRLSQFADAANPGVFDVREYYHCLGYDTALESDFWERCGGRTDWLREWGRQVSGLLEKQISLISDEPYTGIYDAMLIGKRQDLDEEIRELYAAGGISHILSISGLHLSFIGFIFYRILRRTTGSYPLAGAAGGLAVCFYAVLCGETTALVRAVCMYLTAVWAKALGRINDTPTSAAAAAFFLLWGNPNALFLASFQYSFAAVIGMSFLGEYLKKLSRGRWSLRGIGEKRKKKKEPGEWYSGAFRTLGLYLCLLPVSLWHQFSFSPWSILLNLLVIPFTTVLLADAFLALAVSFFSVKAGRLLLFAGNRILDYDGILCRVSQVLPGAGRHGGRPPLFRIVIYLGLLILLVLAGILAEKRARRAKQAAGPEAGKAAADGGKAGKRRIRRRMVWKIGGRRWENINRVRAVFAAAGEQAKGVATLLLAAGCLIFGMVFLRALPPDGLRITVLDVGQGDGTLVETEGCTFLIDAGSSSKRELAENVLEPVLYSRGCDYLDAAFLSHADYDHISGVLELLEKGSVRIGRLFLPAAEGCEEEFSDVLAAAEAAGTGTEWLHKGDTVRAGGAGLMVCAPQEGEPGSDENEKSLVLLLGCGDFSMLFTGDLPGEKEEGLELPGHVDVLKAAHHGSKYSTTEAFLQRISPTAAVVCCGKNNRYGHPAPEVIDRLEKEGAAVFQTKDCGAVIIESDGVKTRIRGFREG